MNLRDIPIEEADYDPHHLRRVAIGLAARHLRCRGLGRAQVDSLVEDIAHEAIARALDEWDPERTDKGPVVLIRYRVIDAIRDHYAPPGDDAGVHVTSLYGEGDLRMRLDGENIEEAA